MCACSDNCISGHRRRTTGGLPSLHNLQFSGVKAPSNKAPVEHVNEADMDDAFMARLAGLAN